MTHFDNVEVKLERQMLNEMNGQCLCITLSNTPITLLKCMTLVHCVEPHYTRSLSKTEKASDPQYCINGDNKDFSVA